jgi:hypothetical protein
MEVITAGHDKLRKRFTGYFYHLIPYRKLVINSVESPVCQNEKSKHPVSRSIQCRMMQQDSPGDHPFYTTKDSTEEEKKPG